MSVNRWGLRRRALTAGLAALVIAEAITTDADAVLLAFDRDRDTFVYKSASGYSFYEEGMEEYNDVTTRVLDPLLTSSNFNSWRDHVCKRVGRSLTRNEWRIYVPSRSYRRTCPRAS